MSPASTPDAKENYILEYVEAAVTSSDRARAVIIVMITASVLAIMPTWNAGGMWEDGEGWMDSRINTRKAALRFFDPYYDPDNPKLSEKEKDMNRRAFNFLESSGLKRGKLEHKKILDEEITQLKKIRSEQMNIIHTPFFGAAFDVNDLGFFSGITFAIVLVWLRFSLARELRNLKLAFNEAESKRGKLLRLCYDLLAMHQVLSVPPMPREKRRFFRWGRWFWVSTALSLYLVPALVYGYHLESNRQSIGIGMMLNPANVTFQLKAGAGLWSLIIVLTITCFVYHLRIDGEWRRVCKKIEGQHPSDPEDPSGPQSGDLIESDLAARVVAPAGERTAAHNRKSKSSRQRKRK